MEAAALQAGPGRLLPPLLPLPHLVLELSLRLLGSSQLLLQLRKLRLKCSASRCLVGEGSNVWPCILPALCDAGCRLLLRPGGARSGVPRAGKRSAAAASRALRGVPAISLVSCLPCGLLMLIRPCSRDQADCAGAVTLILMVTGHCAGGLVLNVMAAGHAWGSAAGDQDLSEGWPDLDRIYGAEGVAYTANAGKL